MFFAIRNARRIVMIKGNRLSRLLLAAALTVMVLATACLAHASTLTGMLINQTVGSAPIIANAGGTYSFVPATGVLSLNWTSSDFPCNGPGVELETNQVTSLTATTMTFGGNNPMTFTRS